MTPILLAHAAATTAMAGIIWFVRIAHIRSSARSATLVSETTPAPTRVGRSTDARGAFTTMILLLVHTPQGVPVYLPWAGAVLLAIIWLSTGLLQIPLHRTLGAARIRRRTEHWYGPTGYGPSPGACASPQRRCSCCPSCSDFSTHSHDIKSTCSQKHSNTCSARYGEVVHIKS